MTLGMVTVVILAVSAALCAVATVSFYQSNVFNDKRKNYLILTMGIAATIWNISLIGYSISTKPVFYNAFFYVLILAFDVYMIVFGYFVGRLTEMNTASYYLLGALGVILSVGDWIIFGLAPIHEYFKTHGRTAYYTSMSPMVVYHYFYIMFYLVFWVLLVCFCFKRMPLKRQHM